MILSNKLYLLYLFYALVFWMILWGIEIILLNWVKEKKRYKKITFYIPLINHIFWTLFISYFFYELAILNSIIVLVLVGFFVFLGRNFLQNFFAGIFFRLEKYDLRGESVIIGNREGVVLSFGLTCISLKSNDGSLVHIPYKKLYKVGYMRTVKTERSEVQVLKIMLDADKILTPQILDKIRMKILLNPYIAANESINITTGNEGEKHWLLINYILSNPERANYVKEELQKEIANMNG